MADLYRARQLYEAEWLEDDPMYPDQTMVKVWPEGQPDMVNAIIPAEQFQAEYELDEPDDDVPRAP